MKSRTCELCNGDAAVYCLSDSAYLCWNCDSNVHEANFLVARHVRQTICSKCKQLDGNHISGVGLPPLLPFCRSCSTVQESYDSDCSCTSSASTCISSSSVKSFTSSRQRKSVPAKKRKTQAYSSNVDMKAEAILVNWSRKLGVESNDTSIALALHAFSICLARITSLPFRVTLAASFWLALKLNKEVEESTCQYLRRLEEISGVPAKLILLSEKKIARVLKINRKQEVDLTEGWAECSN